MYSCWVAQVGGEVAHCWKMSMSKKTAKENKNDRIKNNKRPQQKKVFGQSSEMIIWQIYSRLAYCDCETEKLNINYACSDKNYSIFCRVTQLVARQIFWAVLWAKKIIKFRNIDDQPSIGRCHTTIRREQRRGTTTGGGDKLTAIGNSDVVSKPWKPERKKKRWMSRHHGGDKFTKPVIGDKWGVMKWPK